MKKIISIFILVVFMSSCQKTDLELINPNSPTPDASLTVEDGILAFSKGLYVKGLGANFVIAWSLHSFMGDELYSPYGNWGWRWAEQVTAITLPNGTVLKNPIGPEQKPQLQSTNSRTAGDLNVFKYEWESMNLLNASCNLLLASIDKPETKFTGDAAAKKATLRAWAYWWKGYAYSHIGSMYVSGIVNNNSDGTTNGDYITRDAIIAEATSNFDKCIVQLNAITAANIDAYNSTIDAVIPDFAARSARITPDMWKRQINSYKARNLMANKKVASMTATDWAAVTTLANAGMLATDNNFRIGMDPNGTNDLSGAFYHPFALLGLGAQFTFVSERLIQEFDADDARLAANFYLLTSPNLRNDRGFNFGTRYGAVPIESGGKFATSDNRGFMEIGATYEETRLDIAEANIRTGSVEAGLTIIDQIRAYQGANVATTAGRGLTQADAIVILKRERRVALFQRGTAFYDARRWGVTQPAASGGGRAAANVLIQGSTLGTTGSQIRSCFIDYNFMDYFDIPLNELDFNPPAPGSAPVKQ
ncbi:RagB/SusD family nutrient uptake outer membrane protein [Pedobacter riviphilus]|uniref:RagB/SusD family nutrient uptake outer membrane protein n=1 Tax=Pedobacter riviphilus TaxID=2766984 RepID=A0ABX6TKZ0_9SPHI|nr:RagB/SusD family nutrient uptake outer membrane protein [Pedobacter riviphilus]QNR85055.1 RagB/SusD family nutrient uptake outer membrane protein [Pedobacter riviphilus]